MHETYPGHHAESCSKEHLLVRGRGLLEETLVLVPTPQSLVSEGIAKLAPSCCSRATAGLRSPRSYTTPGIELDLAHALAVERALEPCEWADVNAALMLHDARSERGRGAGISRALGSHHPEARGPLDPLHHRAGPADLHHHLLGRKELCRSYVAGEPERFRRLLTEQVRVRDLLEARAGAPISPGR